MSAWPEERLEIHHAPHISTISRILRDKEEATSSVLSGRGRSTRRRLLRCEALYQALNEWVWDQYARNVFISDDLIRGKGRRLLVNVNEKPPEQQRIYLQFSAGGLEKFKRRHGFKMYKSHGEAADADEAAIERELPFLFSEKDIWKADEFGLIDMMAPNKTVGPARTQGRKKQKQRLAFLL